MGYCQCSWKVASGWTQTSALTLCRSHAVSWNVCTLIMTKFCWVVIVCWIHFKCALDCPSSTLCAARRGMIPYDDRAGGSEPRGAFSDGYSSSWKHRSPNTAGSPTPSAGGPWALSPSPRPRPPHLSFPPDARARRSRLRRAQRPPNGP